jgi:hypothetical protein
VTFDKRFSNAFEVEAQIVDDLPLLLSVEKAH